MRLCWQGNTALFQSAPWRRWPLPSLTKVELAHKQMHKLSEIMSCLVWKGQQTDPQTSNAYSACIPTLAVAAPPWVLILEQMCTIFEHIDYLENLRKKGVWSKRRRMGEEDTPVGPYCEAFKDLSTEIVDRASILSSVKFGI